MKTISNKGFNLLILDPTEKAEDLTNVDFVHQNGGLWKAIKNPLFTSLQQVEDKAKDKIIEIFDIENTYNTKYSVYLLNEDWKTFNFSKRDMLYVMKYFRTLYDKYKVEAAVVLMLNTATKDWKVLFVPQVDCSGTAVNYLIPKSKTDSFPAKQASLYRDVFKDEKASELMEKALQDFNNLTNAGYGIFGTIHSHCDFAAFHSGVDDNDEQDFDGIHITIGNVNSGWTFKSRVMLNRGDFDRPIDELFNFTIDELKNSEDELAEIEIDPYHIDLMMPDIGSRVTHYSPMMQSWKQDDSLWNNWKSKNHDTDWWEKPSEQAFSSYTKDEPSHIISDDDDDEWDDFVHESDEVVALFDRNERKYIIVSYVYWLNNRDKFPNTLYDRVECQFVHRAKKQKHKDTYLFNDKRISNGKISSPYDISNKVKTKNLKRKAKKK